MITITVQQFQGRGSEAMNIPAWILRPRYGSIYETVKWLRRNFDASFPYKLSPGDLCYNLFTAAGFVWGGWFSYNPDYQHFYYTGG